MRRGTSKSTLRWLDDRNDALPYCSALSLILWAQGQPRSDHRHSQDKVLRLSPSPRAEIIQLAHRDALLAQDVIAKKQGQRRGFRSSIGGPKTHAVTTWNQKFGIPA